jgi:hypothetical protein
MVLFGSFCVAGVFAILSPFFFSFMIVSVDKVDEFWIHCFIDNVLTNI